MRLIRSVQAIFIAIISLVYIPFLNIQKLNLIKEDFKHFTN